MTFAAVSLRLRTARRPSLASSAASPGQRLVEVLVHKTTPVAEPQFSGFGCLQGAYTARRPPAATIRTFAHFRTCAEVTRSPRQSFRTFAHMSLYVRNV